MQIAHLEFKLDNSILTQRTLHLRIGAHDVSMAIDNAARKLREEVSVPGFRKGKAPLALIRKHHRERVQGNALSDLRQAAQDQVFKQLEDGDKPFLPPEVLDQEKLKLRYGRRFEFTIKYMVDPTGIGQRPEHPMPNQGAVIPGSQVSHTATGPIGIPAGPKLPEAPETPGVSRTPTKAPKDE